MLTLKTNYCKLVAPARGRGLKCFAEAAVLARAVVAPARERGLKCFYISGSLTDSSRSREGAWIEIRAVAAQSYEQIKVAPARERGLKYEDVAGISVDYQVAPVRERGLKYYRYVYMKQAVKSLP